jgi:hypothetical protein
MRLQDGAAALGEREMSRDGRHPGREQGITAVPSPDEPQKRQEGVAGSGALALAIGAIVVIAAVIIVMAFAFNTGSGSPNSSSSLGSTSVAMPQDCTATGPVVFVVSGRQNSPVPALVGSMEKAAVEAIDNKSPIGVLNLDGRPGLVFAGVFSSGDNLPSYLMRTVRVRYLAVLARTISQVRAKYPDANVLDALEIAGEAVRAACSRGGTIYLADSGLQETSPLNFHNPGLLASSPAKVVATLTKAHDIPNLSGMTVTLVGIGNTAPPQDQLSIGQRANLINIWSAIVKAAGAHLKIDTQPRDNAAPTHVPSVQLVPTR